MAVAAMQFLNVVILLVSFKLIDWHAEHMALDGIIRFSTGECGDAIFLFT